MSDLLSARSQMAVSLGFHIIFACVGMVMPFLMIASHRCWLKTKEPIYYEMTKAWSKGGCDSLCSWRGLGHSVVI